LFIRNISSNHLYHLIYFSISRVPYSEYGILGDQARQLDIKPFDMICLHRSLRVS